MALSQPSANNMDYSKKWYLSKGLWGSVSALLATLLIASGHAVNAEEVNQLFNNGLEVTLQIIQLVGAIVAFYGRLTAKHRIE